MTDTELATRAPENDMDPNEGPTMMTVPLPSDPTPPAPFTPHCNTDRPLSSSTTHPTGDLSPINGITCYISKPKDYPSNPSRLLLLLTPGTGILSTNNQLQADAFTSRGYVVVMPDQFNGDPAPNSANTATSSTALQSDFNGQAAKGAVTAPPHQTQAAAAAPSTSIIEKIKLGMVEASKSFVIDMWLARHTPATIMPRLKKVVEGVREQFADAVANGGGIYGVGYCSGAKYIVLLCGENPYSGSQAHKSGEVGKMQQGPELKCGVIAHGTLVTKEDLQAVRTPMTIISLRDDPVFPEEVIVAGRESFRKHGLRHKVEFYDDVPHGFAVIGDYEDKSIVEKQKEVFEVMCEALRMDDGDD